MITLLNDNNKGLYFIAGGNSELRRPTEEELAQLMAAQQAAIDEREAINKATSEGVRLSALSGQRAASPPLPKDYPTIPEYIELEGGGWLFNVRTHRFNDEANRVEALPYSSLIEIICVRELIESEVARLDAQAREAALNAELIDAANQERLYALEERVAELERQVEESRWSWEAGPPVDKAPEGPPIDNRGDREGKPPIEWEIEQSETGDSAHSQEDKEVSVQ